jgi:geranylgeranyl diphosphate synthase type II
MNGTQQLKRDQQLIEAALKEYFTQPVPYASLYEAMRYSLLAGGKRIRPVLVLESCAACGGRAEEAMAYACALEMVHTYSLIHDDLPCMDNDDLRRGKPTCHKVYGEDMATLAGDGLLTAAFGVITGDGVPATQSPSQRLAAARALAQAAGEDGMVAGQVLDLQWEQNPNLTQQELEQVHSRKTGALLRCACKLGHIAAGGDEAQGEALDRYATALGLAFQIRDDILDVTSTAQELGKPIGSDAENGKTTFVTLLGLEESQALVEKLTEEAKSAVAGLPDPAFLRWLADLLAGREN